MAEDVALVVVFCPSAILSLAAAASKLGQNRERETPQYPGEILDSQVTRKLRMAKALIGCRMAFQRAE